MVLLVVLFLTSGFFTVGPQERKVVLRFGKTVGSGDGSLLGPGWHWAFPPPIDEVVRIPFAQSLTVSSTVGWYRLTPDEAAGELQGIKPRGRPSLDPSVDGYTLVGDGNIVHARAILTYRVQDPIRYEFDFVAASNSVQNALDNALVYSFRQIHERGRCVAPGTGALPGNGAGAGGRPGPGGRTGHQRRNSARWTKCRP